MADQFNALDPLGIIKMAKNQIDTMATQAGLSPLPSVPGLQQRTEVERGMVHRERFPDAPVPARGTGMARLLDPLGLFNREQTKVDDRGFSRDRGV